MRTNAQINADRADKGMIGTLEAIIELLFDIRNRTVSPQEMARLLGIKYESDDVGL